MSNVCALECHVNVNSTLCRALATVNASMCKRVTSPVFWCKTHASDIDWHILPATPFEDRYRSLSLARPVPPSRDSALYTLDFLSGTHVPPKATARGSGYRSTNPVHRVVDLAILPRPVVCCADVPLLDKSPGAGHALSARADADALVCDARRSPRPSYRGLASVAKRSQAPRQVQRPAQ